MNVQTLDGKFEKLPFPIEWDTKKRKGEDIVDPPDP